MKRLNCAIYTRKSSDEGLEKEFNSLDAQREACAAYITSQKHAGWIAVRDLYDDGGLSGGTMERPALKRLLADIKSGKVRGLAVTTAKPALAFPTLPTMGSVFPGFDVDNWYAMFMPAGTPRPIIEKLNAEIVKALKAPDVQDFMAREGGQPVGSPPQELAAMFKREVTKYARVIDVGRLASN